MKVKGTEFDRFLIYFSFESKFEVCPFGSVSEFIVCSRDNCSMFRDQFGLSAGDLFFAFDEGSIHRRITFRHSVCGGGEVLMPTISVFLVYFDIWANSGFPWSFLFLYKFGVCIILL